MIYCIDIKCLFRDNRIFFAGKEVTDGNKFPFIDALFIEDLISLKALTNFTGKDFISDRYRIATF